jgi:hypothetical protein
MAKKDKKYTSEIVVFEKARLSYPSLLTATAYQNGDKKEYKANLIFDNQDDNTKKVTVIVPKLLNAHFGANGNKILSIITDDKKLRFYREGNKELDKDLNPIPYLQNKLVVIAKTAEDNPHEFYDANGKKVEFSNTFAWQTEGRKFYGGCYANVVVQIWVQDNDYGKAIRCKLLAVQFAGDGEPLGGTATKPDVSGFFKPSGAAVAEIVPELPNKPFGATPAFMDN